MREKENETPPRHSRQGDNDRMQIIDRNPHLLYSNKNVLGQREGYWSSN